MQEGTIKVVVAPGRSVKRGGRYFNAGDELQLTQAEFAAYPGLYVVPGTQSDPVEVAKLEKAKRDEIDRADKLRRMEEDQKRREEAAARDARILEERAQLAKAGAARLQQRGQRRAG